MKVNFGELDIGTQFYCDDYMWEKISTHNAVIITEGPDNGIVDYFQSDEWVSVSP